MALIKRNSILLHKQTHAWTCRWITARSELGGVMRYGDLSHDASLCWVLRSKSGRERKGGYYLSLWMSISVTFPSPIQLSCSLARSLARSLFLCLSLPLSLSVVLSKFFLILLHSGREWHAEWHQAKSGWNTGIKNSLSVMAAYSNDNDWCALIT